LITELKETNVRGNKMAEMSLETNNRKSHVDIKGEMTQCSEQF
jgi:hypothetical protein